VSIALCWGCLAASVAAYVYVSNTMLHEPFHVGLRHLRYFDLRVYRGAAWRVLHDRPLYARSIVRHLGFTYPPFAALLLIPFSLMKLHDAEHVILIVSITALLVSLRCAVALAARGRRRLLRAVGRPGTAWAVAAFAAGAALWLEPVTTALGYGQIDLVVLALVISDVALPDDSRLKGAGIGLAAAIKLTPLLFLPYLLLSGRRRAALVGSAVFAATIVVGFVFATADSTRYWGGLFLHSSRVGPAADIGNQSLRAALARLVGTAHPGMVTLAAVVAVAMVGLMLAVRAARRDNEAAGYALCAVTVLLATPVTWSHHWTLAIPGILALALIAYERRSPLLALASVGLLALGYAYLPAIEGNSPLRASGLGTLQADPYVLAGLAVLAAAVAVETVPALQRIGEAWVRYRTRPATRIAAQ
jgi:alpha-1,2-mannosyltransferase